MLSLQYWGLDSKLNSFAISVPVFWSGFDLFLSLLFVRAEEAGLYYTLATNKCATYRWSSLTDSLGFKTIFLLDYAGKLFPGLSRH